MREILVKKLDERPMERLSRGRVTKLESTMAQKTEKSKEEGRVTQR